MKKLPKMANVSGSSRTIESTTNRNMSEDSTNNNNGNNKNNDNNSSTDLKSLTVLWLASILFALRYV